MNKNAFDTVVNLFGSAIPPIVALATAPILAGTLGTAGRGEVAAATAPLLLAVALASLGLPTAVNHWVSRSPAHTLRVFTIAAIATSVVGAGLTWLVCVAGHLAAGGDADLARLIGLASLALVPNLMAGLLQAVAAGHHAWRLVALERGITHGSRLIALVTLMTAGTLTVETAVLVIATSPVIGAAAYFRLLRRHGTILRPAAVGQVLSYGGRVWFGALAGIVLTRVDQSLMAPLAGTAALGIYAVAVSLSDIPLVVSSAVRDVAFSRQSSNVDRDGLARASRVTTLAVLATCGITAALLPWFVPTFFGTDFTATIPVTLLLLAGCALSVPGSLAGVGLAADGRPGLRSTSLLAAAACNLVLLIALAPEHGAMGAALATVGGTIVSNGMNLLFARRTLGLSVGELTLIRRADFASLGRLRRD
ncbi:oligosaccharide flippase family protein [Curtobacterium sp. GD1]|uniref:oligosaccharide flippase family protein n=1 Tax=Curtobacterium sp. GD1 TaxID=2810612 RepID=UPI001E316D03|nr:oligosaccharide flippase family protein [Curtobacterium sp. GD1]MCC8907987.1 oligosaccharide flippase family protein [Curtobacterium sp. GD1]